ncbi:MAG: hypothetical protein C0618_04120 [Desulfuromonas sp.]|nr:MAG: hypothetical protein C0618_04120 [Desulfuromonas sp.]
MSTARHLLNSQTGVVFVVCVLLVCSLTVNTALAADLQGFIRIGLQNNLGLQSLKIEPQIATEQVRIEAADFDPEFFVTSDVSDSRTPVTSSTSLILSKTRTVHAEAGIRKTFALGTTSSLALETDRIDDGSANLDPQYTSALTVMIQQPLLRDAGSQTNLAELKVARIQHLQAQYRLAAQARDLALQIELLFYELAAAQQLDRLNVQASDLVAELLEGQQAKLDAGLIPISDVQEAQTELAYRQLQQTRSQLQIESLAFQLNSLLQLENSDAAGLLSACAQFTFGRPRDMETFSALYDTAKKQRFDVKILELDAGNQALTRDSLRNQTKPRLDLSLSASIRGVAGDAQTTAVSGRYLGRWSDSVEDITAHDGHQWAVGLAFSQPWGNTAAKARSREADLRQRQIDLQQRQLHDTIKTELQQRLVTVKRNAEQCDLARRVESLAAVGLKQERQRLDEGLTDTFRVLAFLERMVDARVSLVNILSEYHKNHARLNRTLGLNLQQHGLTAQIAAKEIRFESM